MKTFNRALSPDIEHQILPKTGPFNAVFLDIETTGFHREHCYIMLIGVITYCDGHWICTQWFAESREDEPQILKAFLKILSEPSLLISFNGTRFDLPFIAARLAYHHFFKSPQEALESLLKQHIHVDLLTISKHLPERLENYRLKTIESYLNIYRTDNISGGESVQLYYQYLKNPTQALLDSILLHNADDIENMLPLWQIFDHIPPEISALCCPQINNSIILWVGSISNFLTIEGITKVYKQSFLHFGAHQMQCEGYHFKLHLQLSIVESEGLRLDVVRYPDFSGALSKIAPEKWLVACNHMPHLDNINFIITSFLGITEM